MGVIGRLPCEQPQSQQQPNEKNHHRLPLLLHGILSRCQKHKRYSILSILMIAFLFLQTAKNYQSILPSSSQLSSVSSPSPIEGQLGTISCPHYTVPKRDKSSEAAFQQSSLAAHEWVRQEGLSFLREDALQMHQRLLDHIESQGIPGMIVECGVAKAGSAIAFAAIKHPQRCLHLFDTFEGIPEPNVLKDGQDVQDRYKKIQEDKQSCLQGNDNCNKEYYGNLENLLEFDQHQFQRAGYPIEENAVYFHKGLFGDTVWPAGPIAYAHLDGDWYDSTYQMLERISPFLSEGGYFVLDDVYQWSGARNAFIDYFQVNFKWLQSQPAKYKTRAPAITPKSPSCWTIVTDKQTDVDRYYRLFLDVRAVAQAISAKTAQELRQAKVRRCVMPSSSRRTNSGDTTTPTASSGGTAP